MSTYKSNVKLCRAIANQPILYDESNEHYRKRLPSENCWDLVASELGEPADKCKRRWRQIRNDYVRWISSDNQRQRNGQKRPGFYLAEELQFLNPHLSGADRERDSPESERGSERDSKSKSKEPAIEEYKGKQKDIDESVEEQPLAKLKQTAKDKELEKEKDKGKEKEKEKDKEKDKDTEERKESINKDKVKEKDKATDKRADKERKSRSEGPVTPTSSEDSPVGSSKQEFFIKQNNSNSLSNCLIIGVKPAGSSASDSPLLDSMADDSADETASMGGGRRLRRGANRTKNSAIQKASVEQRLTRLQRRKSMTMAAANSLLSSTSPVKMTPVPRTSMPASTTANANAGQPKAGNKAPAKHALAGARDDIFPRPRAAAPVNQQVVLARHPGVPLQMPPKLQPPQGVQAMPPRPNYGIGRPPGPARLAANAQAKRLLAGAAPPGPRANFPGQQRPPAPDGFKAPATSSAPTSQAQAQAQAQLQQQQLQPQRGVSSSNTLVISTTNNSSVSSSSGISSMANMSNMVSLSSLASIAGSSSGFSLSANSNSNSTPSSSFGTQTASITASPIVSTTPPTIALIKRCERGNQTECQDIFSDEHFLEMVRPQMKEMNPRQKMHFKQKIFQALIEIFDDATDFPASGEVQHFNINTPSGFDHVTDDELRLIRELVSMVGAAKHTAGSSPGTPLLAQRVATPKTPSALPNAFRPTLSTTPLGDEKKLYRIMKTNNQTKIVPNASPLTDQRKDSVDSISSSCTVPLASSSARSSSSSKFAVPGVAVKAVARPLDPLNQLFGQGGRPAAATAISPKEPILVRQMGRRYSVCGGGGPANSLGANGINANANIDVAVLKRRITPIAQPMAAPAQRPRYSPNSQPPVNPMAAIPPGNSLLMRRAVNANGGQRQASPLSASVVPQKTPQIASIQGNVFNEFATPTAVRGGSGGGGSPSGISPGMPPLKRAMIVANAKTTAQPKPTTTLARSQVSPASGQVRSASQSPGSNVANLLAEPRPEVPNADMAGTIAADDFDMGRLKREPVDPDDTVDILGI